MAEEAAEELREALRRAEEELQRQAGFLAIVAHELRNPISPVLMSLEALYLEVSAGMTDRETLLARIGNTRRYAQRLRQDLDRLLDFSRLRSGQIDLVYEEVDLSALAASCLDDLSPVLRAARCEVRAELGTPQWGHWDRMRLNQVIWNLISNAAKYAPDAVVEVRTAGTETHATLVVADHGPGIPVEEHELVFRKYERVRADAHRTGFGVGLWLVRSIVQALGGTIELASSVGAGTTFTVSLPRRHNA